MLDNKASGIVSALLAYRREHPLATATFTDDQETNALNATNPFAFLLAAAIDRGALAENVWKTPLWLKRQLGHLDPAHIAAMSVDEIEEHLRALPKQPRYPHLAARTMHDCATQVCERWHGDAANIWRTQDARDISARLEAIFGVGPGISHMILNILYTDGKLSLPLEELKRVDGKSDVQVVRVFYRSGLTAQATERATIKAARDVHPAYPGELDQPAWQIGREFCHPANPDCAHCPLTAVCAKMMEEAEIC